MHKIIKNIFKILFLAVKTLQSAIIFSSLVVLVYFVLTLTNLNLPKEINDFFGTIYNFQNGLFQLPEFFSINLTLTVFSAELLLIAFSLIYVLNFIVELERIYDKIHHVEKRIYEDDFNDRLIKNLENTEKNTNKFSMLLSVKLELIQHSSTIMVGKNINLVDLTNKLNMFIENKLHQNFNVKCTHIGNNLMFSFENIEDCDRVFEMIFSFIRKTKEELKKIKVKFDLNAGVCITSDDNQETLLLLQGLANIGQWNKILMYNEFKIRYDKFPEKKFKYTELGEYQYRNDILNAYAINSNINLI